MLKHPQSLPAAYYKAIGEITARWTLVELHVQSLVWHFLKLGYKEGRLLTHRLGARDKVQLLKAVTLRWVADPAIKKQIEEITKAADKLNDRRNEIVHGLWGHEVRQPKKLELFYIKSASDKILPRAEQISSARLKMIAEEIAALDKRLLKLHTAVGAQVP